MEVLKQSHEKTANFSSPNGETEFPNNTFNGEDMQNDTDNYHNCTDCNQNEQKSENFYNGPANSSYRFKRRERDPTWLQVEVCRDFLRNGCSRSQEECRYAHPNSNCAIENGKVTTCYDNLKSRCARERCKYFHPPEHIKQQIHQLGKSYQKTNYNYNENLEQDLITYAMYPQYPIWWPYNIYVSGEVYSYPGVFPGFGYYDYMGGMPFEDYSLENVYDETDKSDLTLTSDIGKKNQNKN